MSQGTAAEFAWGADRYAGAQVRAEARQPVADADEFVGQCRVQGGQVAPALWPGNVDAFVRPLPVDEMHAAIVPIHQHVLGE